MASITRKQTRAGEARYVVRYRDLAGRSREEWFPQKRQATLRAAEVEADKRKGIWIDPKAGRVTLDRWMDSWFSNRANVRPSTIASQQSLIRTHIAPTFGSRHIASLRTHEIQGWVSRLSENLAPSTVRSVNGLLNSCLEAAVTDALLNRNPAKGVTLPQVVPKEMRILSPAEVGQIADSIDPRFRSMVLLGAFAGMRWGEIAGLQYDALNLLKRTVIVKQSLKEVNGSVFLGPPKTRASYRTITLPRFVARDVGGHLEVEGGQ